MLVAVMHRLRQWLTRRRVRRSLDGVTGVALFGFAGKLAIDSH
jgi:threonine/homoserine/homoserine lactone efflux protein